MERCPALLPEELEMEILLKLPIKSLLRFLSVCKRWRSLIQSPSFTSHNSRKRKLIVFREYPIFRARVFNYLSNDIVEDLEFPPFSGHHDLDAKFSDDIQILGPVNNGIYGLFTNSSLIILWNPTTRFYRHIHSPISLSTSRDTQPIGLRVGFGYDESINDHKVVVIRFCDMVHGMYKSCRIWIYNHATNSWSNIQKYQFTYYSKRRVVSLYLNSEKEFSNCFVNGDCHWSCGIRGRNEYDQEILKYGVLIFNMANETFKVMNGPDKMGHKHITIKDKRNINRSVWVLRDTIIVVVTFVRKEKVEVWIMKEYGVEDSWNILCSIAVGSNKAIFGVAGKFNEERISLRDNKRRLISYGFEDRRRWSY